MVAIKIPQPKSLNDMVFNDTATEHRVRQYATGKRAGNIILNGPKGTGKTTAAKQIVQTIFDAHDNPNAVPEFHATQFVKVKDMESRIYGEWILQRACGVKNPYVIINEADQLSQEKLRHIRGMIDETEIGQFIFTTNNIHAFDEPLLDRCDDIEMPPIDIDAWRSKVYEWLADNKISVDADIVERMLKTNTGTIRDLKRIIEDIACEIR